MLKSIGIAGAFGAFGVPVIAVAGIGLCVFGLGVGGGFLLAGAKGAAATGAFLSLL